MTEYLQPVEVITSADSITPVSEEDKARKKPKEEVKEVKGGKDAAL